MSGKGTAGAEQEKEGATAHRAASCGCMTMAEGREGCGSQMREMMSRFMASCGPGQKESPNCGDEGGDDREDK